jgi:hypothetical protein
MFKELSQRNKEAGVNNCGLSPIIVVLYLQIGVMFCVQARQPDWS